MRTTVCSACVVLFIGACLSGCGRKQPEAAPKPAAPAPTAQPAPAKLSAAPALDPKGTINWAQQNLDAAKAKEQSGTEGL